VITPELPELDLPPRLARWASQFKAAAACFDIDVAIFAAIIDRESLGGDALQPKGPGGVGDKGNGRGLGQIDARYHGSFIQACGPDGIALWRDPTFNLMYAAKLLRMNLGVSGGSYPAAIAAYNASLQSVLRVLRSTPPGADKTKALDELTTGKNYVSDVLARAERFRAPTPAA
jgi:soluble lytic murein transglycosylase-like protein